jgi:hypothetical protein
MIIYFSGGSQIAETELKKPRIMLSFYVCMYLKGNPKKGRVDKRCRTVMKLRKKARMKNEGK